MLTSPDYYHRPLTEDSQQVREKLERDLSSLYAARDELTGVKKLKLQRSIDLLEERLSWQGANPKEIPFADMRNHIRHAHHEDPIENKYQERIKNRATGIRAYCVMCQGGTTAGVKECPSVTCPLHPFRMGKDPLRGYELPKPTLVALVEDDEDADVDNIFEDGDDAEEADATE